eukprot:scaffold14575_cov137-Isochrysis_galbana.AAC.3
MEMARGITPPSHSFLSSPPSPPACPTVLLSSLVAATLTYRGCVAARVACDSQGSPVCRVCSSSVPPSAPSGPQPCSPPSLHYTVSDTVRRWRTSGTIARRSSATSSLGPARTT